MFRYTGLSLIEVLISLLLLSLMLLGFDAMQLNALREARTAYYFSVATQQLNVMAERLRVAQDVNDQLTIWNRQNQEVLPQGRGMVSGHYPEFSLAIFWGNRTAQDCHHNQIGQSGCLRQSVIV